MKNLFKARWMTSLIFLIALFFITGIAAPGFLTYDLSLIHISLKSTSRVVHVISR